VPKRERSFPTALRPAPGRDGVVGERRLFVCVEQFAPGVAQVPATQQATLGYFMSGRITHEFGSS
jgi:hypothetical protein